MGRVRTAVAHSALCGESILLVEQDCIESSGFTLYTILHYAIVSKRTRWWRCWDRCTRRVRCIRRHSAEICSRFAVLRLPSCYAKRWHEAIVSLRTYSFCQAAFRIWPDWHARKRALDAQSTILEAAGSSPCPCHSGRHPPVVVLVLREVAIRSIRDQAARSGHTGCRMQRVG